MLGVSVFKTEWFVRLIFHVLANHSIWILVHAILVHAVLTLIMRLTHSITCYKLLNCHIFRNYSSLVWVLREKLWRLLQQAGCAWHHSADSIKTPAEKMMLIDSWLLVSNTKNTNQQWFGVFCLGVGFSVRVHCSSVVSHWLVVRHVHWNHVTRGIKVPLGILIIYGQGHIFIVLKGVFCPSK